MEIRENQISQIVRSSQKDLRIRAQNLSSLKITLEDSWTINRGTIVEQPTKQLLEIQETLKSCRGNRLYRFSVSKNSDISAILKSFEDFHTVNTKEVKGGPIRRNLSKWNKKNNSPTLYFGSKKDKTQKRFEQHLGYGYNRTYALHLRFWFPKNIPIKFELFKVEGSPNQTALEDIEQGFWDYFQPMFGKKSGH